MQLEKEKYKFDYEDIQSELDKALGAATRVQKEKDNMKMEADHYQDKYEKAQVSFPDVYRTVFPKVPRHSCFHVACSYFCSVH